MKGEKALFLSCEHNTYYCQGAWSITSLTVDELDLHLSPQEEKIFVSGKRLSAFDSAGALILQSLIQGMQNQGKSVELIEFSPEQHSLLALIDKQQEFLRQPLPRPQPQGFLSRLGKETLAKLHQVEGFTYLIGDLSVRVLAALGRWRRFRFSSIVSVIHSAGIGALPIVGLLSFLIGVVLAYQMGLQLQTYGANIFIAYLSGLAIFREFAPLITAIIVAGRTSSAFTAQLGSMKINEEIDALDTMGLSPTELLILPKLIGLTFIFPLLIFWADAFSLLGSMLMSKWMLSIGYNDFLLRLKESVGLRPMMLGLYKAPAFSMIIALVGCFQGFAVEANADSIGSQTTKSVVQSLFLIIIADAAFSVFYSWMGL